MPGNHNKDRHPENPGRFSQSPFTFSNPCPFCGGHHKCSRGKDGLIIHGRRQGEVPGFHFLGEAEHDPQWGIYRAAEAPVAYLGASVGTLRNWTSERYAPLARRGRAVRYHVEGLDLWLTRGGYRERSTTVEPRLVSHVRQTRGAETPSASAVLLVAGSGASIAPKQPNLTEESAYRSFFNFTRFQECIETIAIFSASTFVESRSRWRR
jgi:hypothetical protein